MVAAEGIGGIEGEAIFRWIEPVVRFVSTLPSK